jgi:PilZ domain
MSTTNTYMAKELSFSMKPRYKQRLRLKFPVMFTWEGRIAEGHVWDMTNPGCQIESSISVTQGQSLQLELFLPGHQFPLAVALGVVRWTKGKRFGVEFIKMHESQQRILTRFMTQHCADGPPIKIGLA